LSLSAVSSEPVAGSALSFWFYQIALLSKGGQASRMRGFRSSWANMPLIGQLRRFEVAAANNSLEIGGLLW